MCYGLTENIILLKQFKNKLKYKITEIINDK